LSPRARHLALALAALLMPAAARAQHAVEVQVAPPFLHLRAGAQTMLLATAYDPDGNPVNARITWNSTNINVATIDSAGVIRAVAPGLTIVTAALDSAPGTRRIVGHTTVLVGGWSGPDRKQFIVTGDSVPPAACADPEVGVRNIGRACWDVPPLHRGPILLDPPAGCPQVTSPAVFAVRVDSAGGIDTTRTLAESNCAAFQAAAQRLAGQASFAAAHRNGRAVAAWTILVVRSTRARIFIAPPMPEPPPPGTSGAPGPPAPPAEPGDRSPPPAKQPPRP